MIIGVSKELGMKKLGLVTGSESVIDSLRKAHPIDSKPELWGLLEWYFLSGRSLEVIVLVLDTTI